MLRGGLLLPGQQPTLLPVWALSSGIKDKPFARTFSPLWNFSPPTVPNVNCCGVQGYRGDGINCVPDVCQKVPAPCFKDVECYNIEKPPYYKCGVCPEGLTGNGTWCNDLDECDLADPCDVAATCYNLIPGFRFAST